MNAVLHASGKGIVFPSAVSVSEASKLFHEKSNLYAYDSPLFIVNNSYVDFGNTDQTFFSLSLYKGVAVGANATVTLSTSGNVVLVKSESTIGIKNLILMNGGYMQLSSIKGIFDGSLCEESFMTMDLGGHSLNLDVHHHEAFSDFSMGFNNVIVANGSVLKYGAGSLFFSGQLGTIPALTIQSGNVYIGTAPLDIVDASGDLQVGKEGCLGGFGTLGRQGNAVVYNEGTVKPGTDSKTGMLRISGSYNQSSSGTLLIKALNKFDADRLVVDQYGVSLDGALVLQAKTVGAFHAGDQIVILDNSNGDKPIMGQFSSFHSDLPPHLKATIQYDSNQVKVLILDA